MQKVPSPHLTDARHVVTMIPVNLHQCNNFFKELYGNTTDFLNCYEKYMLWLDVLKLECNFCHKRGECVRHGYYERGYLLESGDLQSNTRIMILRVRCKGCGHTHAVLPDEVVPYYGFTIPFIYSILDQYYGQERKARAICEKNGISMALLYSWKKRFERQKDQFLGLLESGMRSARNALDWLKGLGDYVGDFARKFLKKTGVMPMRRHRNPPNTRRPVFG